MIGRIGWMAIGAGLLYVYQDPTVIGYLINAIQNFKG